MIWETLSLSRLQKMLKLGEALSEKHALEEKPRVQLDNFLLTPQKEPQFRVLSHTEELRHEPP